MWLSQLKHLGIWLLACCWLLSGCTSDGPQRAREDVLKTNLSTLRAVISQHQEDRGVFPEKLESLVDAGYLRRVPTDPLMGDTQSWTLVYEQSPTGTHVIRDVHSSSQGVGLNGIPYNLW